MHLIDTHAALLRSNDPSQVVMTSLAHVNADILDYNSDSSEKEEKILPENSYTLSDKTKPLVREHCLGMLHAAVQFFVHRIVHRFGLQKSLLSHCGCTTHVRRRLRKLALLLVWNESNGACKEAESVCQIG